MKGQHTTHRNRDILQHLMNAMPLRRIVKVLDISFTVLYDRIDFLYEQCQLFAGERERTLLDRDLRRLYLSVDRQKLLVNWTTKASRKNTRLLSIATADQATGYVFAANVNFDGALDSEAVQQDGLRYGDDRLPKAFRRHARVWLGTDWEEATAAYARRSCEARMRRRLPRASG